ncbi:MAG TPA: hypothetical protein VGL19_22220 [Polyangiaceae bacterium]
MFFAIEASIFLDRFLATVGVEAEAEPKFDVGAREVSRCARFITGFRFCADFLAKQRRDADSEPQKNA